MAAARLVATAVHERVFRPMVHQMAALQTLLLDGNMRGAFHFGGPTDARRAVILYSSRVKLLLASLII